MRDRNDLGKMSWVVRRRFDRSKQPASMSAGSARLESRMRSSIQIVPSYGCEQCSRPANYRHAPTSKRFRWCYAMSR